MPADTPPRRVDGIEGTLVGARFGAGSKSAHEAVWLESPDLPNARIVLRRKDGPAFDDRDLAQHVGKRVRCDGFIVAHTLLADRIDVIG